MTGLRGRWWRSIAFQCRSGSAFRRSRYRSPAIPFPASALRSIPAQKSPPAPVRTTERTVSSASASSQPSYSPTSSGSESAFFASGLFMVSTIVAPCRSAVRCSVPPIAVLPSQDLEQVAGGPGAVQEFPDTQSDFLAGALPSWGGRRCNDRRAAGGPPAEGAFGGEEERWSTTLPTCSSRSWTWSRTARPWCTWTTPGPAPNAASRTRSWTRRPTVSPITCKAAG